MKDIKWKILDECKSTYFIELGNKEGIISIFTNSPERTEEIAHLLVTAPKTKKQRDDLLAICKEFMIEADDGSARFDDPAPDSIFIRAEKIISDAESEVK